MMRRLMILTAGLALANSAGRWASASPTTEPLLLQVQSGQLQGVLEGRTRVFRGIPYAQAPIGQLRWRAPKPPVAWSGVRSAKGFGNICVQPKSGFSGATAGSEDCLFANVWTPAAAGSGHLPVMVFIHGGFFARGSADEKFVGYRLFDGRNLSEKQKVIVVTLNYRLAQFGYLAHPALTAESQSETGRLTSGNYGLLDQLQALQWVRQNISAFGGDPDQVTLFGQSAGAISVTAIVASPLSQGLIRGAIIESTLHVNAPLTTAEKWGTALQAGAGCPSSGATVLQCLRAKTPEQIVAALPYNTVSASFGPNVDGVTLPRGTRETFTDGQQTQIPMIVGNNANEASTLMGALFPNGISTPQQLQAVMIATYGPVAAPILLGAYSVHPFSSPADEATAIIGDGLFICPTQAIASLLAGDGGHPGAPPVWSYVFSKAPHFDPKKLGAGHALELPYVFGNFSALLGLRPNAEELALSAKMMAYWGAFARTGNPNVAGAPPWAERSAGTDNYQDLTVPIAGSAGFHASQCGTWKSLGL